MLDKTAPIGLYGKIPSQGDFYQRDLPPAFVRPWDEWLARSMVGSQEALGGDWAQIYLLSPPWRFQLSPGLCGDTGWIGVLVASIDRVNRFFPLTLALPIQEADTPLFLSDCRPILDKLESAAFALIDAQESIEAILARASAGISDDIVAMQRPAGQRYRWMSDGEATAWVAFDDRAALPLLPGGHLLYQLRRDPMSLWWHDFWEPHAATTMLCKGLPPVRSFSLMLDSQWRDPSLRDLANR